MPADGWTYGPARVNRSSIFGERALAMRMSTRNIILCILILPIAWFVGTWVGQEMPILGLLFLVALLGFVAWILLSNKQGKLIDGAARADALAFKPAADAARIYVVRKGFMGGMQGMNISIDGGWEGQIRSNHFMMANVAPGTHQVSAKMAKQGEAARGNHSVTLAPGGFVVLDIGLEMGMVRMTPFFKEITDGLAANAFLNPAKMVDWLKRP
jgi:hypothetical protein